LLQHGDAPMIEPGQLMPRFVFIGPCFAEHITYNECLPTLAGKSCSGLDQL
jgi:hypothetical protein